MNEEQIRQIIREEIINTLGFSSRIPLPIDQAIRDRFLKNLIRTYNTSEITPADRDQSTSAGGGDLVPQVFTGLIKGDFNGVIVYIPYYQ